MSKWSVIDIDKTPSGEILGATYAMRVPRGMIIRNVIGSSTSMVFVPIAAGSLMVDTWIEDNKIS